jgi:hypothetical protein
MKIRVVMCRFREFNSNTLRTFVFGQSLLAKRTMGGYIEDAQIASLGLEIYQDLHGKNAVPQVSFVIPTENNDWPVHLWGYELGIGVQKHLTKYIELEKADKLKR